MPPVTIVIITYNEEANIAACIASVKEIASEILVLDSFSTDTTREIATSLGARVETHEFDGHIQQKNRAKNMAKNEWVLSLDADERLSNELRKSIVIALENTQFNGYEMNRLNYFCGKPIKTCGWYPDKKLRLWKKETGQWGGSNPHDRFELFNDAQCGFLNGDLLHYTYSSKNSMKLQIAKFATIGAGELKNKSFFYLLPKLFFSPMIKFIRSYIFKAGFTSGLDGFFICRQLAREVFLRYYYGVKQKQNEEIHNQNEKLNL